MRSLLALGACVLSFSAYADGLRLFNPTESAARAAITCEGVTLERILVPRGIDDVDGRGCTATSAAPLLVLETGTAADGVEWQRAIGPASDTCPSTVPLMVPSSACRFGTAVVAVDPVPGASYSWSIDGGSFLAGTGTERVTIAFEGADSVKISVAIAAPGCTQSAAGVIALRDSFQIAKIDAGTGMLGQPRTITWSYANGAPAWQVLTGSDFGTVTLAADARSYSYVPSSEGDKSLVLQARSGSAPAGARRRASGKGAAAASDCSSARATASYHVDCAPPDATIVAPSATNVDTAFTARVNLDANATASWTVVNGTPATATGPSVSIKPSGTSPVDVGVTVVAGSCTSKGTKRVSVDGTLACDNPGVTVAILRNDCNETSLLARFSGRAPFAGTWSDGQQFTTNDRTLERSVGAAGTYSITSFRDAACAGPASNSVTVVPKIVKATLSAPNGACARNTVMVTFVGTPPFKGTWSDGVAFESDTTQTSRTASKAGPLSLEFKDSSCPFTQTSNTLVIDDGVVTVSFDKSSLTSCATSVTLDADVTGGVPPYSVTWSDGVTQSQPAGSIISHFVHSFSVLLPSGTFGVSAAHDAVCSLKVPPPLTATAKPSASFETVGTYCLSTNAAAMLYNDPGPGASITWTVENGSIVSGQGTKSIIFHGLASTVNVTCAVTVPSGCSDTKSKSTFWILPPTAPQLTLSPGTTVAVGTTVSITWPFDTSLHRYAIGATGSSNQPTAPVCNYNVRVCSSSYVANTAGTIQLTAYAYNDCNEVANGTATLTVHP
jgi:hypothetical protein